MDPIPKQNKNSKEQVYVVAGGHLFHDLYTSFLAPLLPTLIENLSLSLTSAGFISAFARIPSILNPFIGYLADKKGAKYFVILSPALTASLMSLLGIAPNVYTLALILFFAGMSSTMFHAASPGLVASASSDRKGFGLSLFMAGGGLGRTLGPLLVIWAAAQWGLPGIYRVAVLGWAASIILFFQFRKFDIKSPEQHSLRSTIPIFKEFFFPLSLVLILRSTLTASLNTYLPIYMVQSGAPLWMAGAALSTLELAGVIGALAIGPLSDTFGRRKSINISMLISAILVPIFLQVSGWLVIPLLLLLGFFSLSTGTLFLALVQDHFQDHRATGNGVYLLISLLSNAVMLVVIGYIGDHSGLRTAYLISSVAALLSIPALKLIPAFKE
ncbi:MAG: MFS transporter [Anaerolineales bacterium]|nr:MFS transporter [Anaerolineales bacterium]